jgi:hypothetical protein
MPIYSGYAEVASATTPSDVGGVHTTPAVHVYLHIPVALFKARVNMASVTYPVTRLTFDTVTLGTFDDVEPDMTLLLGSAEGLDDLGRVRVQNVATVANIPVGRVSRGVEDGQLEVTDNAYITVLDDYRVWAKLPYETLTDPSETFKDSDVAVGDFGTEPPPVAIMGAHFADYIDPITGLITVAFDGSASYCMADGATIVSYAWVIGDGTVTVGSISAATLTATFPAGKRWVHLSVVDSNGKGHTGHRFILAVDPASDVTLQTGTVELQRLTIAGQTLTVRLYGDVLRTTFPDGTLVMLWHDAPSSPSDRSFLKFVGWHQSDTWAMRATKNGLVRDTVLTCLDVAGRLDTLPGFPQALERNAEEQHWAFMPELNISRALHYLLHWHSSALVVADFFLPATGSSYPAMRLDSTGASLFDQTNSRALSIVPDHYLTCDISGTLRVLPDWMLKDVGDRPAASTILTEDDYSDIRADYSRPPKVHVLRSSAVIASTAWEEDAFGEDTLPLAFSIAPGDAGAFGQGVGESTTGEKLTISQAALNICEGHRFARLNSRDGLYSISLPHSDDVWDLEPALMQRIQLNVAATYAAQRGLSWTQTNGIVKEIQIRYATSKEGLVLTPTLTLERETFGYPATTVVPPDAGTPDDVETEPPPILPVPPGIVAGVEQLVGIDLDGNIYRTSDFQTVSGSGGPTWTQVSTGIAEVLYSFVVDPFSPGYILGAGSIDGWVATADAIYKLSDMFGTLVVDEVHTFSTSAVAANFHWRSIQASFGGFFAEGVNPWLLCVSYYGATVGHTGTWATHSLDGGTTWSTEVQISAFYNTDTPTRFNPIGVYTSPRTPGLAYTAAHIADETVEGKVSTDWGETWASSSFIEPGVAQAGMIHLPWHTNSTEALGYFGKLTVTEVPGTPDELMPEFGWQPDGEVYEDRGMRTFDTQTITASEDSSEPPGVAESAADMFIVPPATTKRMLVGLSWTTTNVEDGLSSSATATLTTHTAGGTSKTDAYSFSYATHDNTVIGSGTVEWEFLGGSWPADGARIHMFANANASGGTPFASMEFQLTATVIEIELDDGTIYEPEEDASGRAFRLKKTVSGTITDISPTDGTRLYGVQRFGFGVRALDSNRQYLLLAGIGNDVTGDPDDDFHGVFFSSDYGVTWTNVVTPIADTGAPAGRPAFEAAFSPDDPDTFFVWGPPGYISYTDSGAAGLDDRSGDLPATDGFIGIAGGIS